MTAIRDPSLEFTALPAPSATSMTDHPVSSAVVDIEVIISEAPGMLMRAAPATGGSNTYVISDRASRVQMGLR